MGATDQILARLAAESEEHQQVIESIAADAEKHGRDLGPKEMELIEVRRDRIQALGEQMEPLKETSRIGLESRNRISELHEIISAQTPEVRAEVEYRSAGEYILDYWQAAMGVESAVTRMRTFNRAAAHQTTADNPGLLPTPIVAPVVNFIDTSRPLTTWLGPKQVPSNSWVRPKVTQHTNVALQPTGEKNELVSQKMLITKLTANAQSFGGYVNVSRQDIDWTSPNIMDLVIQDLAARYGIVTESALCQAAWTGGTSGPIIPTGAPTAAALSTALWTAAASVFTATSGQGRLAFFISADMLGMWAPLFAPINPQNAISPGFEAANFSTGAMGQISGIPVYMDAGLTTGQMLLVSSSALEVYEDRKGSLSVIEPSVLGVQVAYFGYYSWLIIDAGGVQKITKTP